MQEEAENEQLRLTCEVLLAASAVGVHWVLLAPASSLAWRTPWVLQLAWSIELRTDSVLFDWCRYGRAWLQTTRAIVTAPWLRKLGRRCRGDHEHERLWGTVCDSSGTYSRAEAAATWSRPFCRRLLVLATSSHLMLATSR